MTKTTRFFRILGRTNAILFFLAFATLAVTVAVLQINELIPRTPPPQEAPPPAKTADNVRLEFGSTVELGLPFTAIELNARDSFRGKSFSSGESVEKRNYLLIDQTSGASHWLLPDHNHVIVTDATLKDGDKEVAHVLLVKAAGDTAGRGRILLTDATMQRVVELATDVDDVHSTALNGNACSVITKRENKLRLINADAHTLTRTLDVAINPPATR